MSDNEVKPEDIDNSPTELPTGNFSQEQYLQLKASFDQISSEKVDLLEEKERLVTKNAELTRTVHTNTILDSLIVPFANRIFVFMCVYCTFVGCIVAASAHSGKLTPNAIEILAGSTAVTVIGLTGTIVAGIFAGARRGSN